MPQSVSVITVYYNTPEDLRLLSASMQKHLDPSLYEWIIVDNASQVNLQREVPNATYLRMDRNLGYGTACNRGVEASSTPALFLLNPDCAFIEDCVSPLLLDLERVAVSGPRVLYPDGHLQLSFGPFLSISNEARQKKRIQNEATPEIQDWLKGLQEFSPDYVSGCAMMVRADVFRAVGGFDEKFFLYHEDVDLCLRIRQLGYSIVYNPKTRIVHGKNSSAKQEPKRVSHEYRKSQLHYYRKHHGWLQNALLKLYLATSGKLP